MTEFTNDTYYDPYKRRQVPVLTEEQVASMWPNNVEKKVEEKRVVSTKKKWREEDALAGGYIQFPSYIPEPVVPLMTPDGDLTATPERASSVGQKELEAVMSVLSAGDVGADMVVLPTHYSRFQIEPIRFICENNLNWFQGNIVKYILRYDAKNGMEDLKKAKRYLDMFIKWVDKDPDWWKKT